MSESITAGVYRRTSVGALELVHAYLDDEVELLDVKENFDLGRIRGEALELASRELRTLHVMANAESFDHSEAFISMCLAIAALDSEPDMSTIMLVSID